MIPRTAKLLAFALVLAVGMAGRAFAQFETRATFAFEATISSSVAVGDFNRDGKPDVAVANYLPSGSVNILLGNGDGTFRVGANYAVAVQPALVVAADLRHNGILDLVVGDTLSNNVYVMLGNGDGTFQPAAPYPASGNPALVGTGDFNGDGKLDIIALAGSAAECGCVEVLPGNGDGTFQAAVITPVPYNIDGYAMATGYFNHDNRLDVAVAGAFGSANQVDILLGNGDGTFRPHGYYEVASGPYSVVAADFNGDNKADLAVGSLFGQSIGVLLGNGDGTFQRAVNYPTQFPIWATAHDLDGDGKLDLVATNSGEIGIPAGVSVLKGNGDGTFQPGVFYEAGDGPESYVAVGDFNDDGMPDLAVTYDSLVTLLNTGRVSFSPTTPITFPTQLIGTISAPLTATLTNNGTSPLTISSVTYSGTPFKMRTTCKGTVAPGANCTVSGTFTPQAENVASGTVTIKDSASSKPQVVELVGTGTVVKLSPTQLTFPPQKVGTKSAMHNVKLTNTGSTPLDFTDFIYIDGPGANVFFETNDCPTSLAAGGTCTIRVTFKPRDVGPVTDSVYITDTGGGSPQLVPLGGIGD